MRKTCPLAFIGGGTMAEAIVRGIVAAGTIKIADIAVAEPRAQRRAVFESLGVQAMATSAEAIQWLREQESGTSSGAGQILLAVKPQSLEEVAGQIGPALGPGRRVIVSILAGTPTQTIRDRFGRNGCDIAVVRVMPNMAAQIRMGMAAIALGAGTTPGDDALALRIFEAVGDVIRIDEQLMDAFTAVAGSGPAYVFYLAQAMSTAATKLGFDEAQAKQIVQRTIAGAGALLAESPDSPEGLRAAVTSKGGTTAAATAVLDESSVMQAMIDAITAARDRGRELSRE